jgi:hypothetical protein
VDRAACEGVRMPVTRTRAPSRMKWYPVPSRRALSAEESTLDECYYQGLVARRTSWGGERLHAIETGCDAINERI